MSTSIRKLGTGHHQVRWRSPEGKQCGKTFPLLRDARRFKQEIDAQLVRGDYIDASRGRMTFSEAAEAWIKNPRWDETTKSRNSSVLRLYVLPRWGAQPLSRISHEAAQAWVHEMCDKPRLNGTTPLAPRTIAKVVGVFRGVMAQALRGRRIAIDPSVDLVLPRAKSSPRRYLDAKEVERLANAAGRNRDAILFLAYTGLRFSEFAGLKAKYVDLLQKRVRIEEVVVELDNGEQRWKDPKDHERRTLMPPDFVFEALAARLSDASNNDLVFPSTNNTPIRNRNFRRDTLDPAIEKAGIEPLTPHELRHTAASMAVSAGARVLAVQRMLGHEKASTTLDTYSDLFDADLEHVAEALTTLRSKALVDETWMETHP